MTVYVLHWKLMLMPVLQKAWLCITGEDQYADRELILLSGNGVTEVSLGKTQCTDNLYTLHTVGLYLVLRFSNGITVIWDKRTRLSVTLDAKWKVNPTPYYDACVEEACACDLEGKYLGFCTAVAVYAEACNKVDVCIRWRTPDLC
ncbi:hypothetical protein chiPu_0021251, partial [Chiloscyllium punctatum]|nr:hypothetical protein [Chiloscyllium punctatum]